MLRKFRIKFILIATVSVALVLIIVLGLVNFVTYRNATSEIYTTMEFISENSDVLVNNDVIVPQGGKDSISLDTQYAARYFLVDIDNKKLKMTDEEIKIPEFPIKYKKNFEKKLQEIVNKYLKVTSIEGSDNSYTSSQSYCFLFFLLLFTKK